MSAENAREVAITCDRCQSKMQAVADMLLLSCDARPVSTVASQASTSGVWRGKDAVMEQIRLLLQTTKEVTSQIYTVTVLWKDIIANLNIIADTVVRLIEVSTHLAYCVAMAMGGCVPARTGVVDRYLMCQASLELRLSCTRLKRSRLDDLHPQLLVDLCSTMSRALSVMTEVCRAASEHASDSYDQDQFKLCVKSITSTTSCLIASIKSFKARPNATHLSRIVAFCDPVVAASSALVTFATEPEFIGTPATLSPQATEAHKSILGASMSVASASIQMCKATRDLAYDIISAKHRDRVMLCAESIERSCAQLQDLMTVFGVEDTFSMASIASLSNTSMSSSLTGSMTSLMLVTSSPTEAAPIVASSSSLSEPSSSSSTVSSSSR